MTDKLNEKWDEFVSGLTEGDVDFDNGHTVDNPARKEAITKTASKKYVKAGGNIDMPNNAIVYNTVDGDYWVEALVFVEHSEVFKKK